MKLNKIIVYRRSFLLFAVLLFLFSERALAQKKIPTPQWRPVYHFTPDSTWTNDPNGLFYYKGEFHLYYQNNPFDNVWGHMSWGHATSQDLIHWQDLPVAIPEVVSKDTTISIFSGSAVIDDKNTSGFSKNGSMPIVSIFTGDLPKQKKEAQYIAFSNDTGTSYTLYSGNPVIDINRPDFRDPNVFWYEPDHHWIMAVSLVHEHKIRLYASKNLKDWSVLSDFGPAGYIDHDWECPFLIPLHVGDNLSQTKWVLVVSCFGDKGPYMQYFVGDFDGKTFHNDNPSDKTLTLDYGDCFYAAIPWRLPEENILMGWLIPGKPETNPWRGQMSIPRDIKLRSTPEGIRLFQQPSARIYKNLKTLSKNDHHSWKNVALNGEQIVLSDFNKYQSNAFWIDATIDVKTATNAGINILTDSLTGKKVMIGYDAQKQEIFVDCSREAKDYKPAENLYQSAPLKPMNGKIKLQLLLDKSSLEVFANNGEQTITTTLYPAENEHSISLFSTGNSLLDNMSIWDLSHL